MISPARRGSRKTVSTEISQEVKEKFIAWAEKQGYTSYRDALADLILQKVKEDGNEPTRPFGEYGITSP